MKRFLFSEQMRRVITWPVVVSFVLTTGGCSTISVTSKSKVVEVPGPAYYEVPDVKIVRMSDGLHEIFTLNADSVYQCYTAAQTQKNWNEIERKRYFAAVGVHEDYSFWMDILEVPLVPTVIFAAIVATPIS